MSRIRTSNGAFYTHKTLRQIMVDAATDELWKGAGLYVYEHEVCSGKYSYETEYYQEKDELRLDIDREVEDVVWTDTSETLVLGARIIYYEEIPGVQSLIESYWQGCGTYRIVEHNEEGDDTKEIRFLDFVDYAKALVLAHLESDDDISVTFLGDKTTHNK